jgi:serine/threonine protein kinase
VLKQINTSGLSAKEQRECIGEVQLLASVGSPYVVRFEDSFIEEGSLHILMEYCAKGDLHQRLRVSATSDTPQCRPAHAGECTWS